MNYRSISALSSCILQNLHRVPPRVDLIVGVPRSGMLAASIVALALNRSLTDLDGFLEGRIFPGGRTRSHLHLQGLQASVEYCELAFVVDDSMTSGKTMNEVRRRIEESGLGHKVVYCAVFATDRAISSTDVDMYFALCPSPRLFEWNFMHHRILANSCVDLTVICKNPVALLNDRAPGQSRNSHALPLYLPTVLVGCIVASQPEGHRKATEEWLRRHNVTYKELLLSNSSSAMAVDQMGSDAVFKAHVYKKRSDAVLFIGTDLDAPEIARLSGKPVLSIGANTIEEPGGWAPHTIARRLRLGIRRYLSNIATRYLPSDVVSWIRRQV